MIIEVLRPLLFLMIFSLIIINIFGPVCTADMETEKHYPVEEKLDFK